MNSNEIVWPGAIERYLSCGETIAEWKSIECIIGAAVTRTPGIGSSERLVIVNLMRSPTRARTAGPGTVSPKVQALNFTPGAISMTLCVVSRRISFTGRRVERLDRGLHVERCAGREGSGVALARKRRRR